LAVLPLQILSREDLHRHYAIEALVARPVDHPHSTSADLLEDAEVRKVPPDELGSGRSDRFSASFHVDGRFTLGRRVRGRRGGAVRSHEIPGGVLPRKVAAVESAKA